MNPITREEYFLAKIAGEESPEIQPVTREEIFLAKAAGMDVPELEPVTRKEWFISQISGGGGGGGGGSSYHLIASQEFDWTYTSTTEATIDTMQLPASVWSKDKMLFVKIRLVGSAARSTFLGSDSLLSNSYVKQGYVGNNNSFMKTAYYIDSSDKMQASKTATSKCPGITGAVLSPSCLLSFNAYKNTAFNISGHFKVDVYDLDWPDDISPYNEY